ncbi:MAG TPA: ABC transporter ATP-binding protein [Conexibacter sp.]|nr:ABC transporter ATP-binding protein [Conexibacter sp.]
MPATQDRATTSSQRPAIAAEGVTRRFPGVIANDRVSFEVLPGEVHALLGENGSGKTTLCKILTGLHRPDEGRILVDGEPVRFGSPRDAYAAGVFMVQQHFSLVDRLTVAENVVLGWTPEHRFRFDAKEAEAHVARAAREFQMEIDPAAFVWQLSVGERQRVELLKALYRGARTLILDEPTTVLTPQECGALFATLRQLVDNGHSIVFISHKLHEVMALCDRVTVLRQGRAVGTTRVEQDQLDPRKLAQLMVGREIALERKPSSGAARRGQIVLDVDGVSVANDFGRLRVKQLSLTVHEGEVLGIAGVAGNGQRELAETIAGLRDRAAGTVRVAGCELRNGDPRHAIDAGVAYVPEDRMGTGLAPGLKLTDNIILKSYRTPAMSRGPLIRWHRALERTRELLERFNVKGRPDNAVRQLSGGNAQKVLLAREMSSEPKVLIVAAPTRGLDVSAMQSVRELLIAAAGDGVGVVLISEDLDEIFDLADRVAVIHDGRVMGVVDHDKIDRDEIGMMMAGMEVAA